ncbi:PRD domain-containing protein [Evansella halocellulosilytica]|uniref:PRD domain-containing protein n=1 Tax=Evansella halocellulosilytica TaxID=2011013 RepID=UPI000BB8A468|nr:PRD domain-containing protein [Evansella halocellulosilytica]
MNAPYTVHKALNNNVVIARDANNSEVILIGKGIGFGKKFGDELQETGYDKIFVLADEEEQEKYKRLLSNEGGDIILIIHEAIEKIHEWTGVELHERIHYALTQHLILAIQRTNDGTEIQNPFLTETKWLYFDTYNIAKEVVEFIHKKTGVLLPEAEVGFITLHVQSAIGEQPYSPFNKKSELISRAILYAEEKLGQSFNKESVHFQRLIHYLKEVIDRSLSSDLKYEKKLIQLLKEETDVCYNVARNIMRMIEKATHQSISQIETMNITIYLHRLIED